MFNTQLSLGLTTFNFLFERKKRNIQVIYSGNDSLNSKTLNYQY